jgi:uncharacterized membrane protein YeaQ/YmgE (transglycosylase-associated protein family)
MSFDCWIVLGAIAGYLAGFLVRGDESLGVIGTSCSGLVGACSAAFLAGALIGKDPNAGRVDIDSMWCPRSGASPRASAC